MDDLFYMFAMPFNATDVAFYCFVTRPWMDAMKKALGKE
jgi:hypothetical protein